MTLQYMGNALGYSSQMTCHAVTNIDGILSKVSQGQHVASMFDD